MSTATTFFACLLLASLFLGGQAARQADPGSGEDWEPPKWYHRKDGPHFEIMQYLDEVEQRRYEAGKWMSANITGATYDDAYNKGTQLLNEYWKGNNKGGVEIDDTVPTLMLMYPTGVGRAVETTFTIEYFLPHELHAAPPLPHSPEVGVVDVQTNDVWVRVFGGYVGEKVAMDQGFGFLDQLKGEQLDVDDSVIGLAFYDEPRRIIRRHNEIWIWAKPSPSSETRTPTVEGTRD